MLCNGNGISQWGGLTLSMKTQNLEEMTHQAWKVPNVRLVKCQNVCRNSGCCWKVSLGFLMGKKIPWMEEPGRLQSMGSRRLGHDWATPLSLFTFMHWRRKWQPTPVFLPGEPQGQASLVDCRPVYGVAQSRTQLTWLSSSSTNKESERIKANGKAWSWQEPHTVRDDIIFLIMEHKNAAWLCWVSLGRGQNDMEE